MVNSTNKGKNKTKTRYAPSTKAIARSSLGKQWRPRSDGNAFAHASRNAYCYWWRHRILYPLQAFKRLSGVSMTPRMRDAQTKMYGKRGLNKQVVDDHDHDDDIFALYSLWVVHNKTFYIFFFCFARFGRRSCLLLLLLLLLFSFFFHLVLNLKYICDYAYSLLPAMTHDRFKCFKRSKETVARIDTYAHTQPSREFTQFTFHFKYDDTLNADMLTAPQQRKRIRYVCGYFMQTLAHTHTHELVRSRRAHGHKAVSLIYCFFWTQILMGTKTTWNCWRNADLGEFLAKQTQ